MLNWFQFQKDSFQFSNIMSFDETSLEQKLRHLFSFVLLQPWLVLADFPTKTNIEPIPEKKKTFFCNYFSFSSVSFHFNLSLSLSLSFTLSLISSRAFSHPRFPFSPPFFILSVCLSLCVMAIISILIMYISFFFLSFCLSDILSS